MGTATGNDPTHRARDELTRIGRKIVARGLAVGPGGNISARIGASLLISPSGFSLDDVDAADWVEVDLESGRPAGAGPRPSSELEMHVAVYRRRPEVRALVHTHPPTAIGVTAAGIDALPFMVPDQVALVGAVSCLDYVVPCSPELAAAVAAAFADPATHALLLRNHGLVTAGETLREAYVRTEVVEDAARVFWIASTLTLGRPRVLTADDARRIAELDAERYRQALLRTATPS